MRAIRRRARTLWESLRDFVLEFLADDPFEMAAATSYYTLLSLTPVVLLAIALGGLWFDRATVQEHVLQQIRSFVGPEAAEALRAAVETGSDPDHSSFLAIGIVSVLIGASTVFMQVQSALNKIWDVEAKPRRRSILVFLRHRLLSFGMLLAVGFLLLVSLMLSAALTALVGWMHGPELALALVWQILDQVGSWLIVSGLFAAMFKFLPDVKISWRNVLFGACVTGALFTAGKYLISAYLSQGIVGTGFGAAGSIVVLTVWVYYASLILYLGAEITHVRAERTGERKVDSEFAVSKRRFPTTGLEEKPEGDTLTRP